MRGVLNSSHRLIVRPVGKDEESGWNQTMSANHYLGFKSLLGEQIKYVAIMDEKWVALLGWGMAALACSDRDQHFGWNTYRYNCKWRLKHVANNSRFLILPGIEIKNLASRVLALNLQRLSQDWQEKYGHPILAVETFVNAALYKGTCYKADNWVLVGRTKGFGKNRYNYHFHGNEKLIFIKSIAKFGLQRLKGIRGELPMADIDRLPILGSDGLFELAKLIPDTRSKSGLRHRSPGLLVLVILAILSGAKGYKDIAIWVKTVSPSVLNNLLLRTAPSESTIRRFILQLDAALVDSRITSWLLQHLDLQGKQIALDGKTLRGSHNGNKPAIKLVASIIVPDGIVLSQQAIPETTNEIPIVQDMIGKLPIENLDVTTTSDALHSQANTSKVVFEKKADSVFILKDNQKTYRQEVAEALAHSAFSPSAPNI